MGEVKRWTWKFNGGQSGMFVTDDGPWVAYEDYDTLRAEVERLRKIEAAAKDLVSYYETHGHSSYYTGMLSDSLKES